MPAPLKILFTDLDGTLLNSGRTLSQPNLDALIRLGELGIPRVIATGRSLFSFRRVITEQAPVDYLLFSSGAGTMDWRSQSLIDSALLDAASVHRISRYLSAQNFDYMIQRPIPDNHAFAYHGSGHNNSDFLNRIDLYRDHAVPLDGRLKNFGPACQFVIIFPPGDTRWQTLPADFPNLTVIRATSPLDHQSTWIELFPPTVSKSQAADRLCRQLHIDPVHALAIGNDYNDMDLLQWAGHSVVVENAPESMKTEHATVAHHDDHGFAEAISHHFKGHTGETP